MWIVRLALKRPYTFVVLALLLMIVGPLTILRTPTDIFPNIDIPVLSVIWSYTGLPADEMSRRIALNYERGLSTAVNDIEHTESTSLNGITVVKIFFQPNANVQEALAEVAALSQTQLRSLPPGITPPNILRYNASTVPILRLALSSPQLTEQELFDYGNNFLKTELATVPGASAPLPYGGKQRQIMVDIDQRQLQQHNLSPTDVVNAISAQNLILPSGTAKIGSTEYSVLLNASPASIDGLNNMPVKTTPAGTIYIRDVAHVRDGFVPQTNIVRVDGQRAALLTISKSGNTSTLAIVDRIKAMMPTLHNLVPPSMAIDPVSDQSLFVRASVQGVLREAVIAAGLTALMILLFLGNWRATLIIAISIPLSMITSVIALSALGETINIMTLGGLALAVGILVDDATVAIENVSHQLEQGKTLEQAILDGAQQIAVPTLVSTLSICIVFVPMFFLTGVAHYLFIPLAEAVVFAMLASYFFSRTLVPTLAKYLLRHHHKPADLHPSGQTRNPFMRIHLAFERGFSAVRERYHGFLAARIAHPVPFVVGFLVCCLLSMALLPFIGRDFFPQVDAGTIALHVRAKTGMRVEETAVLTDRIDKRIRTLIPAGELHSIIDNIGVPVSGTNLSYNNTGTVGTSDADVLIALNEDHHPTADYVRLLRRTLNDEFPGVQFAFLPADIVSQTLNFGMPAPIDIQIVGRNVAGNRVFAAKLLAKLRGVPGFVDARIQQPADLPRIFIDVDRTRAQQAGFTQKDVASDLLITLSGSQQTTPTFWLNPRNGVSYNVVTEAPQYTMDSLQSLANIPLTANGRSNILGSLASMRRESGEAVVTHYNAQTTIDIYGTADGRDLGAVSDDIDRIIADAKADLPKGSTIELRGQVQTMNASFSGLLFGLVFAIVLVYLLIVVNFQSWLDPFIIITALPGALAGIVWILFLTHTTLSIPALTGAIMCIGIATANSILVISFAREQLLEHGDAVRAAMEAGYTRFRPVLMTALAMVIGMVPMAIGLGEGGEQNAPLGRAVIGGLVVGTVATLIFVPVVFSLIYRKLGERRQRVIENVVPKS
ncbi:efflux RND transporter permease subunit [Paraburkholderia caballeronis]|uniref:Multidrug efflux pump subunit AcrB n=1 Tax=Paraburkholderia caballeronis TaxID=416943 RepID=A0A1H7HJY1_9BURK|nr:efflux RND transporter permease subunit [Paraburkholderia caballeronis]PXW29518.1 multidrug efflux pump subunit AcrB [Paraburkholderia caballeronis]PXX04777.1 multidrug efflux pump subunit AcrB [Paraburkholderia caballeronis]RAK05838.1 multidrug efflux pump subunit AcrB [Paraburkholderia caballeronis]SEB41751.1 Multidrug efflux pump subunit AcrB [Paraburkholderia caballeronis]SEK49260.1 Multidrug efflux pump subunit AcrB [Paraburkholderia caballeronis]